MVLGLKRREREIRLELAQVSVVNKEKIALLEKRLAGVQAALKNSEPSLEEYKNKLAQAYLALDALKQEIPLAQREKAQRALANGQTDDAEKIFQEIRLQGTEKVAEADFQLYQLAEFRIDYAAAYPYAKEAAGLQPNNPLYLNYAGFIAHKVVVTARPSRSTSARWRSVRRPSARIIPTWPRALRIWLCSIEKLVGKRKRRPWRGEPQLFGQLSDDAKWPLRNINRTHKKCVNKER